MVSSWSDMLLLAEGTDSYVVFQIKLLHGSPLFVGHGDMSQFFLDQKAAEAGWRSRQIVIRRLRQIAD